MWYPCDVGPNEEKRDSGVYPVYVRKFTGNDDILDWLGEWFGFQQDNIQNQRESLVQTIFSYSCRSQHRGKESKPLKVRLSWTAGLRLLCALLLLLLLSRSHQLGHMPFSHTCSLCSLPPSMNQFAIRKVTAKIFKAYFKWCDYLSLEPKLVVPPPEEANSKAVSDRNLIAISLWHLIWGEAANLRFMPECLSFIFHKMAGETM